MPHYRKLPVVIEAVQLTEHNGAAIDRWLREANVGVVNRDGSAAIGTLEGDLTANIGDYIIKGVADEFYPCKPDIFEKTYEPAEPAVRVEATHDPTAIKNFGKEAIALQCVVSLDAVDLVLEGTASVQFVKQIHESLRRERDAILAGERRELPPHPVSEFAEAVLHGSEEHREWLMEAARAFTAGEPLPTPKG